MTDKSVPPAKPPSDDETLWDSLRGLTAARIGLKRAGGSLATAPLLEFKLAHARARDAVHEPLDRARLAADLGGLGLPVIEIESAAADRSSFLMRPDLGRSLAPGAEAALKPNAGEYDVVFIATDGLSAPAVQSHAQGVLSAAIPALRAQNWRIAPLVVVRHGRVALGDAVASLLGASCVAVLIGERPGLTAPDSMGAYLTWKPTPATVDADRNCISNIRPEGIAARDAAFKLVHLLQAMRAGGVSGIALKDDSDRLLIGG